jgi:RNA polymerase sigma-70 factor (ECF subfamily)
MKNKPETEDLVQETFLRMISRGMCFENERHEKAWLIVTASNLCKDALKRMWRTEVSIDEVQAQESSDGNTHNFVLEAVVNLPKEYKTLVYMYYYEDYSTTEIASYLRLPQATVRSKLARARKRLKTMLGGESDV